MFRCSKIAAGGYIAYQNPQGCNSNTELILVEGKSLDVHSLYEAFWWGGVHNLSGKDFQEPQSPYLRKKGLFYSRIRGWKASSETHVT